MIRQILENHAPVVYATLKPVYDDHQLKQSPLTMEDAVPLYASFLALFPSRMVVIDGLDEVSTVERTTLLEVLKVLPVQLLIFSREIMLLERSLPSVQFITIQAQNEDIERLVMAGIESDPELYEIIGGQGEEKKEIAGKVQLQSRGM